MKKNNKALEIKKLEPVYLPAPDGKRTVTTFDRPVSKETKRILAAVYKRELIKARKLTL